MAFHIMNHKTGYRVEDTPAFKNYKDADRYLHKNPSMRDDNQRHYYGVDQVKATPKKKNKKKLQIGKG